MDCTVVWRLLSQHRAKQVDPVTRQIPGGHVVHLGVRLQFGKHALLGSAPIVIVQDFFNTHRLVGHNNLEVIAVVIRDEQIQLQVVQGYLFREPLAYVYRL